VRQPTPCRSIGRTWFFSVQLLILLAISVHPVHTQNESEPLFETWRWASFTTQSGLPSNHVLGIYETSNDIPWVVTTLGIAWYDGYRWNAIPDSFSFSPSAIPWVCPGLDGSLLVIHKGRPYRIDTNSIQRIPVPESYGNETLDFLTAIVPFGPETYMVLHDTALFILDNGVLRRPKIPQTIVSPPLPPLHFTGGAAWLCCSDGLFRWNGSEWKLELKSTAENFEIVDVVEGSNGEVLAWVKAPFSWRGLWEWSEGRKPAYNAHEGNELIQSMDISPNGNVLALYESGDIRIREKSVWRPITGMPVQMRTAVVFKYRKNGDLWVGTESGLYLCKCSSQRWSYWKHPFPNLKNTVHAIIRSRDGLIWLGTANGIEVRREDGTIVREFDDIDGKPIPIVTGIAEDTAGNIWICSGSQFGGAYRWNGRIWKHFGRESGLDAPLVHAILPDKEGRLWFLGMSVSKEDPQQPGAFLLEGERIIPWTRARGLPNKRVYSFVESKDGSFWFGTSRGLYKWHDDQWKEFESFNAETVFAIAADSSAGVWFGSNAENPLGYVDGQDSVHLMSLTDRHINAQIWNLAVDPSGALWVSTRSDEGIVNYRNGTWSSIHLSAGLTSLKLWPLLVVSDRLYIGTEGGGVDILHFDELQCPPTRIGVNAPSIEEHAASVRWGVYPYWGSIPEWESYSRSKLDKLPWSDWSTEREKKFSDLPPGDHTLQIQAKGLFGRYDTAGAKIEFAIAPPLYLRPAFVGLIAFLSIAVMYLGTMLFLRKRHYAVELRQREKNLEMITETTSSAIFIYEGDDLRYVNSSAEKLTGYSRGEMAQLPLGTMVDPEYRHLISEARAAIGTRRSEEQLHYELRIIGKNGVGRWVDYTVGEIEFEGKPAVLSTAIDITERKLAEERLLAYQEQLKSLATELSNTEEEERRRMATYLHDTVSQTLAFCQTKLTTVKTARGNSANQKLLRQVNRLLEEALENLQTLTFELSPPVLYELAFNDAISWLVEFMEEHYQLRVTVSSSLPPHVPELRKEIRTVAFHAIRELLTNVVKHAGTKTAFLAIAVDTDVMKITIQDHGRGFDTRILETPLKRKGGFGLFNIRERLTHLGAHLEICSQPQDGTAVTLILPVTDSDV